MLELLDIESEAETDNVVVWEHDPAKDEEGAEEEQGVTQSSERTVSHLTEERPHPLSWGRASSLLEQKVVFVFKLHDLDA